MMDIHKYCMSITQFLAVLLTVRKQIKLCALIGLFITLNLILFCGHIFSKIHTIIVKIMIIMQLLFTDFTAL